MTMAAVPIVVVDDHAIFRSGLKADLDDRVEVVGEAATVDEAIVVIHAARPKVVLLDVHLPGSPAGGAAVIAGCIDLLAETSFLALSVSDAVLRVAGGDAVFSPRLAANSRS